MASEVRLGEPGCVSARSRPSGVSDDPGPGFESKIAAQMAELLTQLIAKRESRFLPGERQGLPIYLGHQVVSQHWGITFRESLIEFFRLGKPGQVDLIAEGRQVFVDDGELIDLQAIIDGHLVRPQPHDDGSIMSPPRHRMEVTSLDNGQESHNHPERDEEHDETSGGIYDSSPKPTMTQAREKALHFIHH